VILRQHTRFPLIIDTSKSEDRLFSKDSRYLWTPHLQSPHSKYSARILLAEIFRPTKSAIVRSLNKCTAFCETPPLRNLMLGWPHIRFIASMTERRMCRIKTHISPLLIGPSERERLPTLPAAPGWRFRGQSACCSTGLTCFNSNKRLNNNDYAIPSITSSNDINLLSRPLEMWKREGRIKVLLKIESDD
jgi:hypothetical protein